MGGINRCSFFGTVNIQNSSEMMGFFCLLRNKILSLYSIK